MRRRFNATMLTLLLLFAGVARGAKAAADPVPLGPLDKFVSADFCAVLIVHPSRLAKSEILKRVPWESLLGATIGRLTDSPDVKQAMRVENIRRVTVFVELFPGGNVAFFPAGVIEFNSDVDGKALLHDIWKDSHEVSFRGHSYVSFKEAIAGAPLAALVSGKRTILLAPEGTLNKMLDASQDNALLKLLRQSDLDHDVVVEYSGEAAVDRITRTFNVPIERLFNDTHTDETVKMLLHDIKTVSLSLDFSGEKLLNGKIVTPSAEAADRTQKMIATGRDSTLQLYGKNGAAALAKLPPPVRLPLDETLKQALHEFSVKPSESSVSISLPTPKSLPDLVNAASGSVGSPETTPK